MKKRMILAALISAFFVLLLRFHTAFTKDLPINVQPAQIEFFNFNHNLITTTYDQQQSGIEYPCNTYTAFIHKNKSSGQKKLIKPSISNEIDYIIHDLSDVMTTDEKIEFTALLGRSFLQNYDYSRAYNEAGIGTIVSLEDLLSGLESGEPAGVCRDIAVGQAQVLNSLGSYNTYVLRFSSAGYGHVTLITQNPDDNATLYKINYDEISTDQHLDGIEKLHQDTTIPDIGIYYHMYDINGKPVAQLPSGLGVLLNKASFGSGASLDPFLRYSPELLSLDFNEGQLSGRIFRGITKNKEEFSGLAINLMSRKSNDGIFNFMLQMASGHYRSERTHVNVDADLNYSRMYGELQSPPVRIGTFILRGRSDITGTLLSGMGRIKNSDNEIVAQGRVFDSAINQLTHLTSRWVSDTQRTSIKLDLTSNYYAGLHSNYNDIRKQKNDIDGIGLVHNYTLFSNELSYKISSKTTSILSFAYIYRNVGTQKKIEFSLAETKQKISIGQILPSKNLPNWVENSKKRIYTKFQRQVNKYNDLELLIEFIEPTPHTSSINSWLTFSLYFM
ncbi:MAG: hypothetical protein ACMUIP_03550 [bacterium]